MKPPICAQKAIPPVSSLTGKVDTPLINWMMNHMKIKIAAGMCINCIKKKIGTNVRILDLGKKVIYAPRTPDIAPLAPTIGMAE